MESKINFVKLNMLNLKMTITVLSKIMSYDKF
jgi:hypothetical protein